MSAGPLPSDHPYAHCPQCQRELARADITGIHPCPGCGALVGVTFQPDTARAYLARWHPQPDQVVHPTYFDFVIVGTGRVHGWLDADTWQLIQLG